MDGFLFPARGFRYGAGMHPVPILMALFFVIPLIEIYLLIKVGGLIGALPTVFLVVFTAVLGALLLRQQGFSTLRRVQAAMARGQIPAMEMIEAVLLTLGGALLLTPGFFTDALGFLCLIPPARRWLIQRLLDRFFLTQAGGGSATGTRSAGGTEPHRPKEGPVTLEGEFRREDD